MPITTRILTINIFFELEFPQYGGKVGSKCLSADLSKFWDLLTSSLLKDFDKQELLFITEARLLESITSEILSSHGHFFVSKCSRFNIDYQDAIET